MEFPRACSFNSWMAIRGLSFLVISCTLHLDSLKARPTEDVSSAKVATRLDSTTSGSEFAHNRNSIGPKIEA